MNTKSSAYLIISLVLVILVSCKDPYNLPSVSLDNSYLVVEGSIDPGPDATVIHLSRVKGLNDTVMLLPERDAIVAVEDDRGKSYPLITSGNGEYRSWLSLDVKPQYRVRIKTTDGKEYLSDFVPIRHTPPIDSINWLMDSKNVFIYANTHDPQNETRYYRWEYKETWEIHSAFQSTLEYVDGRVIVRPPEHSNIYTCWQSDSSTEILIGTSSQLDQDVIHRKLLTELPRGSEKAGVLYSIEVTQFALDKNEFAFWQSMKKNTEETGSIFDPLPSRIPGNLHCTTDSTQWVIGYVGAKNARKVRIFIHNDELPYDWNYNWHDCRRVIAPKDSAAYYMGLIGLIPLSEVGGNRYAMARLECVDCTIRGTNVKPDFWP